jgi:hypothetical protein
MKGFAMSNRTRVRHKAAGLSPGLSWHELVQPGPKGSERRRLERLERSHLGVIVKQEGDGFSRAYRRQAHVRGWNPGRLVEHRSRLRAVDGGPRLSVLRRRLVRASRASS